MTERPIRVLFVCTHNSARSIMAEAVLRHHGGARFEVHSAGTEPGTVNPLTVRVLDEAGLEHSWARSKSVNEYLGQSFDYVITVCDQARQVCPVFPGGGESIHWGYEDPDKVQGPDEVRMDAFRHTLTMMGERIHLFLTVAQRAGEPQGVVIGE